MIDRSCIGACMLGTSWNLAGAMGQLRMRCAEGANHVNERDQDLQSAKSCKSVCWLCVEVIAANSKEHLVKYSTLRIMTESKLGACVAHHGVPSRPRSVRGRALGS